MAEDKKALHSEIYSVMRQEYVRLEGYSMEQMLRHLTTWDDYKDWVYKYKIESMCEKPYCWYIKTGEFIGDEMRGQVLGLYREMTEDGWSSLKTMGKYDWRYMDEDVLHTYKGAVAKTMAILNHKWEADEEREYYIINIEELESNETANPVIQCRRCGDECYEVKTNYCGGCHEEYLLEDQLEIEAERQADILRGK